MTQKTGRTRILVVDDDVDLLASVKDLLTGSGYEVTVCTDAEDGLYRFRTEVYDLVLHDVNLPGSLSGYGACHAIKRLNEETPLILITGQYLSEWDEQIAHELGADGFLKKPFTPARLLDAVEEQLHFRELREATFLSFRCRECQSRHKVREERVKSDGYRFRCGNCAAVYVLTMEEVEKVRVDPTEIPPQEEGAKVLIVDDGQAFRLYLFRLLTESGFQALTAREGKEGWEFIQKWQPDLVLLDVLIPGINGLDLCKRIKEVPETRHVPVIMMTAFKSEEYRQKAIEGSGADAFVVKPFNTDELLEQIRQLLLKRVV